MRPETEEKQKKKTVRKAGACESCAYFDEENEDCRMDLDEDELLRFAFRRTGDCPYYKFYDEYKSVQKQN